MKSNKLKKRIAIVAPGFDRNKLIEWSYFNRDLLRIHEISAIDATAEILAGTLNCPVSAMASAACGGYSQLETKIRNKEIDVLKCITNDFSSNGFQTGVGDLVEVASNKNVLIASNEVTAGIILNLLIDVARSERIDDTKKYMQVA